MNLLDILHESINGRIDFSRTRQSLHVVSMTTFSLIHPIYHVMHSVWKLYPGVQLLTQELVLDCTGNGYFNLLIIFTFQFPTNSTGNFAHFSCINLVPDLFPSIFSAIDTPICYYRDFIDFA